MKIIHTADWHIGNFKGPVSGGKNLRLEDTKRCIETLVYRVEKEEPDVVLISGDIFNTASTNETSGFPEADIAYDYITMLSMVCPVIVMRGTPNHDGQERFEHLANILKNNLDVHVVMEPKVIEIKTVDDQLINIAAIPGFDRGVYRAKNPGVSKEDENRVFTQDLSNIVFGLRALCNPEAVSVLMAHYTVPGCNMESGQVAFYNQSEPVLLQETLKAADYDLVALGHIHRPQLVDGTENVFYSGAVNAFTFNDENQDRGFWIHHFEEGAFGRAGMVFTDSQFVSLPYRQMYTVRLKDTDIALLNEGNRDDVAAFRWQGKVKDKIVRVLYECTQENNKAFNKATLAKELLQEGAFWVSDICQEKELDLINRKEFNNQNDPFVILQEYLEGRGYTPELAGPIIEVAAPIIQKAMANHTTAHVAGVMKPLSIRVKNYRNYREEEFDFTDITFCTINGDNGAGKSSLFMDAILDCIYEEPREGDNTGWINNADDARSGSIEFTFSVGEQTFRITRTRTKSGRPTLNLAEKIDGEWQNRSAEKLRDTQERILEVIGMDSTTFKSCVLIMQDQYGVFMESGREERMGILGDVLGLDIYAYMEMEARELAREARSQKAKKKTALDINYSELQRLGNPEGETVARQTELRLLETLEKSCRESRDKKAAELEHQEEYLSFLERKGNEFTDLLYKIRAQEAEEAKLKNIEEECKEILSQEPDLLEKVREYEVLQEKERTQIAAVNSHEIKKGLLEQISHDKKLAEEDLEVQEQQLAEVRERIRDNAELDLTELERKAMEYRSLVRQRDDQLKLKDEKETLRKRYRDCITEAEKAQTAFRYETEMQETSIAAYKEQAGKLNDSGCIDWERASCVFLKDAHAASEKLEQAVKELECWSIQEREHLKELEQLKEEAEKAYKACDFSEEAYAALCNSIAEYEVYNTRYEAALGQQKELAVQKEKEKSLESATCEKRERLAALSRQESETYNEVQELNQQYREYEKLKTRMEELWPYVKKKDKFPVYKERLENTESTLSNIQKDIQILKEECEVREKEIDDLKAKCSNADTIRQELKRREEELNGYMDQIQALHQQLGSLSEKIRIKEELNTSIKELEQEIIRLSEKQNRYDILKNAFSKDGIPHNIVRSILPQLADLANSILGQMTGGRLGIDFVPERTQKNGKEVTTLDINIEEFGKGSLPYLSKSGGEKVKASLAAALALAEVKSHSLGIQSGMLFIDEPPFLDSEGIQAYVDSLEVMQQRYRDVKIMAITHDPAMKARFPQSIQVVKDDSGSHIILE